MSLVLEEEQINGGQDRWIHWLWFVYNFFQFFAQTVHYLQVSIPYVFMPGQNLHIWPTWRVLSLNDSTIIQNYFLHCFNVFFACWRAWTTRTSIFIGIFPGFLKLVIPLLNLCSTHSKLSKSHSQHIKCPCSTSKDTLKHNSLSTMPPVNTLGFGL